MSNDVNSPNEESDSPPDHRFRIGLVLGVSALVLAVKYAMQDGPVAREEYLAGMATRASETFTLTPLLTLAGLIMGLVCGSLATLWGLGQYTRFSNRMLYAAVGCILLTVIGGFASSAVDQPSDIFISVALLTAVPVLLGPALMRAVKRFNISSDADDATPPHEAPVIQQHVSEFLQLDRACIEIGSDLIPLVNEWHGLTLLQRIGTLRRDLARRVGMWVPLVRVRDNSRLDGDAYAIWINGQKATEGRLCVDKHLAIHPEGNPIPVAGEDFVDPAFGLPARWISPDDQAAAESGGCTVVDAPSVLITHLREVLRRYSGELLSLEDFKQLTLELSHTSQAVVNDVITRLRLGRVHKIVTRLLAEHVPITNLTLIFEVLSQNIDLTTDPDELVECVRPALGRAICEPYTDDDGRIHGLVFEAALEHELRQARNDDDHIDLPPEVRERLMLEIAEELRAAFARKLEVCLLVDSSLRRPVRRMLFRGLPDLAVIAFSEVPIDSQVEPVATLKRGNGSVATTE